MNKEQKPKRFGLYLVLLAISVLFYTASPIIAEKLNVKQVKRFKTFGEFYPFYQGEHQNGVCRLLHFTGTTIINTLTVFNYNYA